MSDFIEKEKRFYLEVFNYEFRVILTNDISKSVVKRSKLTSRNEYDIGNGAAMCWAVKGKPISLIFLPFEAGVNYIVHESFHAIWNLFKWTGSEIEEEVYAYHLDWLTHNVTKFVTKDMEDTKSGILDETLKRYELLKKVVENVVDKSGIIEV